MNTTFNFQVNPEVLPDSAEVLDLLGLAGTLVPNWNVPRMEKALKNSQLIICVRDGTKLIGFARVITDFVWMAYLNQLAINPAYQKTGLGTQILSMIKTELGPEVSIVLHSAEDARAFYEKFGFSIYDDVYRLVRKY